jgi:golgi SNAP receptor complex member 1
MDLCQQLSFHITDNPHLTPISQAYATRADLGQQRSTLVDMTSRLTNTASQIPGLNNLIRLIHRRRQRDRVIMGVVIGTCTVLILMYLTR